MDRPVAELVVEHPECAVVLERYQLEYASAEARTLLETCGERGLDPARVLIDCERAIRERKGRPPADPRTLPPRQRILRVIAGHHQYLHRTLPFLQRLVANVARTHRERQPSLLEVARIFDALARSLSAHLAEEERVVFPALLSGAPRLDSLLARMADEHVSLQRSLVELRAACDGYVCPPWASSSYRVLFAELAHLEADTVQHLQIEDELLRPGARL